MYFITVFEKCELNKTGFPDMGVQRTCGYYRDHITAVYALHENWTDMREGMYDYALIEDIEEGLAPYILDRQWFKWYDERKGYFEIDDPECVKYLMNFALGGCNYK